MAKADIFVFKFVEINLTKVCEGNAELNIIQSSLMSWQSH